jgi:predicted DNA-binding protein
MTKTDQSDHAAAMSVRLTQAKKRELHDLSRRTGISVGSIVRSLIYSRLAEEEGRQRA